MGGEQRQESWCSGRKARYPGAIGITSIRLVPRAGAVETGAPGGREEGQGCVTDVVLPLELSSEKQLDYEVVSPLPVWESKVEREAREVPRKHLSARRRDCATAPWGELIGAGSLALCQSTEGEARGPGCEAGGCWHCPRSLAQVLALREMEEDGSVSCQSG